VLELDVDSRESIQQARDSVKERYGRLDVLVNNAGVLLRVSLSLLLGVN
jgi:NAD(P)-dependent dehydrogenase (short-subunit alcohol dehydrogenase family)